MTVADAVSWHYRVRWGEPSRRVAFYVEGFETEVWIWDAGENREKVNLYATVGVSARAMVGSKNGDRMELVMGLLPARDEAAKPLALLAIHPAIDITSIAHGHTLTFPEPLWYGTEMRSLLVLDPVVEILPPLRPEFGIEVKFMHVVPIYESELDFKGRHGPDALQQGWLALRIPFWNPDRPALPEDWAPVVSNAPRLLR